MHLLYFIFSVSMGLLYLASKRIQQGLKKLTGRQGRPADSSLQRQPALNQMKNGNTNGHVRCFSGRVLFDLRAVLVAGVAAVAFLAALLCGALRLGTYGRGLRSSGAAS